MTCLACSLFQLHRKKKIYKRKTTYHCQISYETAPQQLKFIVFHIPKFLEISQLILLYIPPSMNSFLATSVYSHKDNK